MRYLPYAEEKSWDEVVLTPTQQIGMERIPGLPVYSTAYNMIIGNTKSTRDAPAAARYFYGVPGALGGMLVDGIGTIGNTALNGYKRAYNNGAALYNNMTADVNYILTPKVSAPQTRLTGRKITNSTNPANYNMTVAEVEKPTRYLANNGQPVAVIVEENPTVIKPVPAQNSIAKRLIVNELSRMSNAGEIQNNPTRTQKLINLYNKIK